MSRIRQAGKSIRLNALLAGTTRNLAVVGITGRFFIEIDNREEPGVSCKKLTTIIRPVNKAMPMEHLNSSAELYLPYNRAVTYYEAIEASANNPSDYSHPQRPSVVIAL